MEKTVRIRLWLISLGVFALVVALTAAVTQMATPGVVTFGIVDHQAAGTAARVDAIQAQWRAGGVRNLAIIAVLGDLAWIWIYALGSYLAGREFATKRQGALRFIGLIVCASAVVFGITDYVETIAQLIQLLNESGSDTLAGIAASVQPIKIAAFIVAFVGVVLALVADRFLHRAVA